VIEMSGKSVLILGASGPLGREVTAQALALGHNVTALVRDVTRLPLRSDRLHVVVGDVTANDLTLSDIVFRQDAVISALGVGQSFTANGLIQSAAPLIARAMEQHGVSRLIFTSAFGVGATYADTPLLPRLFIGTMLRDVYRDKLIGEEMIRRSDLDWTIAYPVGLTDGPKTGRYRSGEHLELRGFPTISRADVAEFLLMQLADRRHVRKGVLVAT
jgi:putative NADH-flavin reductase